MWKDNIILPSNSHKVFIPFQQKLAISTVFSMYFSWSKNIWQWFAGFHEYIDVLVQEGNESRLLVEVDFQSDFQMAKACQNYRDLINLLPETFVGKPKHLNRIVHILCDAGKRSLKEKGIHIGPWRRRKFVQKKWSAPHKRLSLDQEDPGILVSSGEAGMPIYAFGLCCNLQSWPSLCY